MYSLSPTMTIESNRQRLAETIAWCNGQKLINKPIESEEIKQRRALGERAANHAFAAHQLESASLFKWINRKKVKTMQEEALQMHREARLDEIRPLAPQLRTPALKPASDFETVQTNEACADLVEKLCSARTRLLEDLALTSNSDSVELAGGRILCYEPQYQMADGASGYASKGFFDVLSCPPWDTWVCMIEKGVYCYVPRLLCSLAQDGIDVDPVDCIRWVDASTLFRLFSIPPIR